MELPAFEVPENLVLAAYIAASNAGLALLFAGMYFLAMAYRPPYEYTDKGLSTAVWSYGDVLAGEAVKAVHLTGVPQADMLPMSKRLKVPQSAFQPSAPQPWWSFSSEAHPPWTIRSEALGQKYSSAAIITLGNLTEGVCRELNIVLASYSEIQQVKSLAGVKGQMGCVGLNGSYTYFSLIQDNSAAMAAKLAAAKPAAVLGPNERPLMPALPNLPPPRPPTH